MNITVKELAAVVEGTAAAFRCITEYQPTGGPGSKIFPPTYNEGPYAEEKRLDPNTSREIQCVLLDSVQSQANRMEQALLEAHKSKKISLPLLVVNFDSDKLLKKLVVTSLDAPHRIADAIFRDCTINGKGFRDPKYDVIFDASTHNATKIFEMCPTALVFGMWDSTGSRGGMGAKFQRALVSEIVGYDAVIGVNTHSRIDPLEIRADPGMKIYKTADGGLTLNKNMAKDPNKPIRSSEIIHGNVTPSIDKNGGVTISRAQQTTTLSLAVLRRLHFPLDGDTVSDTNIDAAARTALAALGIAAGTLARVDVDLRSRCHLWATQSTEWEILDRPSEPTQKFTIDHLEALDLLNEAINAAKKAGLPWGGELNLEPTTDLIELVAMSQKLAPKSGN